jgi:hypothetical protein
MEFIDQDDRKILRELGKRVAEKAQSPEYDVLREMWRKHNRLEKVRPMIMVSPEGSWCELIPDSLLKCASELGRQYEMNLRQRVYYWEHLKDDSVVDAVVEVPVVLTTNNWGFRDKDVIIPSPEERGAFAHDPPMKDPSDFSRMKPLRAQINEEKTQRNFEAVRDTLGDILEVRIARNGTLVVDTGMIDTLAVFRGNAQLMFDMCDRPKWVHEVMTFMTESALAQLDSVEGLGGLELNNTGNGCALTDELPGDDFDPSRVRLRDLWGGSAAQEFAAVSPEMHYEFALQYQNRILERFGLNLYGCCEPLDRKLDYVKRVPHLRRVSISPWADMQRSSEGLQDRYILSWRPNPAWVAGVGFDSEFVRSKIARGVRSANECGCVLEMILKDTHTVNHEPERLERWVQIAKEVVGA